jgi:RHS repeat-associated protein
MQTTEYTYNSDGSQISDANKGISSITYNALGKPDVITYSGSPAKTVTYSYDASGTKVKMVVYDGTTTTTTDYVGGFAYQNSSLSFFSSPEGRVVKNGSNFEYQYAIGDHQGNTRVLFSSQAPAPVVTTATFEDNTLTAEQAAFQNYPTGGNRSSLELFDHTDVSGSVYNKSQLLNGGNNSQVGLAKSFKVYAGDVIKAEVYAKYWNTTSTTSNISGFATALAGAFGVGSATTGEALLARNALENYGGIIAGAGGSGSSSAPKAFITILLFDQNYNFVDAAFDQISTAGEQVGASPKGAFDLLSRELTIEESGYAFIYLSNENPTQVDVYFDDLKIEHQQGHVIQYNEYYPFGMENQNSWTREDAKDNQFLYNGGTESNSLTGLYDLPFRNYDPVLGRMSQVDPMSDKYGGLSPYNFSFNDPVYWNDPMGADPEYESYGGGGCGCWKDKGAQDYGGEARGANLYSRAAFDQETYGSSDMFGSAFVKYGPGDGGALWLSSESTFERLSARQGMRKALDYAFSSGEKNLAVFWHRDFGARFYKFGYEPATDLTIAEDLVASASGHRVAPQSDYFFEGVPVWNVTWGDLKGGAAFTLPGFGIFVSLAAWQFDPVGLSHLLRHEYGHILQAKEWGENFFYSMIAPLSLESAIRYGNIQEHQYSWTERSANYFSRIYFGSVGWDYNNYPISLPTRKLENKFTIPPRIEGLLPPWWDQ